MSRINSLREQRAALSRETKKLLDDNPGTKWAENSSNQSTYDANIAKIDDIDNEIGRIEKLATKEADDAIATTAIEAARSRGANIPGNTTDPAVIFNTWLRRGDRALSAEQWESIRNTMSTTTPAEGGYTVPTEIAASFIDALKAYGGMRAVSEVFVTATGAPLNYPTTDGTSEVGELIAENTTATDADVSFGTVGLNVFKYSSKVVTVPIELLQDANINVEQLVRNRLTQRLGRITNTHFTTGSGSGQPRGVVTGASSGKVGTTGQTVTVIFEDLIDLIHSVDPSYRELGCAFMMSDSALKIVRKLKDSQGRPLWEPSLQAGLPSNLLGYSVQINQDVAVMAANAKSILFGAFNYAYKIRDAMDISLFRFTDSAFTKKGQVGFLAWMRSGGNIVDTTAVKYYANSAS